MARIWRFLTTDSPSSQHNSRSSTRESAEAPLGLVLRSRLVASDYRSWLARLHEAARAADATREALGALVASQFRISLGHKEEPL
jgi:hypothetical protein